MRWAAVIFVLCIILLANTAGATPLDSIQEFIAKLKFVVFQYNQRGSIGGEPVTIYWANDGGASVSFDKYGAITFNSNGFGENDKVSVQLQKEYNRYFCSTSSCGGFSNWVSSYATITPKVAPTFIKVTSNVAGSVYIDNVMSGMTGNTFPVTPGGHSVKVTQSGYVDYTTSITVDYGATATVSATLNSICSAGYNYNGTGCVPSAAPQGNQQPVKTPLQIVQDFFGWLQDIFSKKVCAQVATTAQNPATLEIRTFNTPCDVPVGWVVQGT